MTKAAGIVQGKLFMRVSDPRGMPVYGMPGGSVIVRVRYGVVLPLAGSPVFYPPEHQHYFPVQVELSDGTSIVWASQRGFVILRKRPE